MAAVTPYVLVEDLRKSVGDKVLFEHVSFAVNKGDHIALIARNGIGKSTLLNILLHSHEDTIPGATKIASADQSRNAHDYDSGKITWRRDLKVHYLPQQIAYPAEMDSWSGGQKKKAMIERVLADEPDMVIMDEPTNHLDLGTVVWLEEQLRKSQVTLLMVTHDRYFLDRVCTDILELDQHQMYAYHGNYSYYVEKRADRIEIQNAETEKARNLYRTELDWMRRMPQARGHKAQYRIDQFYEIEQKAKRAVQQSEVKLAVKSTYIGNKIFEAKYVSKVFPPRFEGDRPLTILRDFTYTFSRYEKLGIIGDNGTGKSSFLKLLLGELKPDSGHFDIGSTVRFGYYRQTGLAFETGKKVIDIVRDVAEVVNLGDGSHLTASQFLQYFLFSAQQQHDYVDKLSGGERQRLHLCLVLMQNPNFLILDEPTNDLDISTLQVLEEYLTHFKGCLIVVSHDRYFMDKVVDHIFVFHGEGEIQDFPGNYTQYRASGQRKTKTDTSSADVKVSQEKPRNDAEKPRRLSFKEKQELQAIEAELPLLEQEKADLEVLLSGGTADGDQIAKASVRYQQVLARLDEKELRWLELQTE